MKRTIEIGVVPFKLCETLLFALIKLELFVELEPRISFKSGFLTVGNVPVERVQEMKMLLFGLAFAQAPPVSSNYCIVVRDDVKVA